MFKSLVKAVTEGAKRACEVALDEKGRREVAQLTDFQARIVERDRVFSDKTFAVFDVQVKGVIPVRVHNEKALLIIHLYDKDTGSPVLCSVESFQEQNSRVFEFSQSLGPVPVNSGFVDWIDVGGAIKETLIFPRKGLRKLEFSVWAVSESSPPIFDFGAFRGGGVFTLAQKTVPYYNSEFGYMDLLENRVNIRPAAIELAMYVAAADGNLDAREGNIIREWVLKVLLEVDEKERAKEKIRLNNVIKNSYALAKKGQLTRSNALGKFKEIATVQDKYDALELCLDVMKADGEASPEEIEALDKIATGIGVDAEKYKALRDRRLVDVKIGNMGDDHLAQLLGISASMTKDEIRKLLTDEFRKWNGRVSSGNHKTKERAQEMLLLIGEGREKFT